MELLITCAVCGTCKSISHVVLEKRQLSDALVLALAGHTPQCALAGGGVVSPTTHSDPTVVAYAVAKEAL